jgi:hypothetical protein
MQHIQGISRHQLQVVRLEDSISQDNPVRFIDAFVHSIHLDEWDLNKRFTNATIWFSIIECTKVGYKRGLEVINYGFPHLSELF